MLKNKKKFFVVALVGFFVICGLCGIISLFTPGSEEASPAETDVPATEAIIVEPTATEPLPSPTSEPTATPEPTDTPLPTAAPTETAESNLSIEEQEYATQIANASLEYADWLRQLSDLSLDAGADPTLLFDDDWTTDLGITLGLLQITSEQMANVEPVPGRFKVIDNYMEQIHAETKLLVKNYASGVDNIDVDLITAANQNMNNINGLVGLATDELVKIAGDVLE